MRKLLFALALCLLPTIAHAQNTTCSDRPAGDKSNACANTRFVQGQSHTPGGTNGQIQYNNAGVFGGYPPSGNGTTIPTTTGTLVSGHCVMLDANFNFIDSGFACSGAANPIALAGPSVINGTATTFMRSDAAPAVNQTATYAWTGPHSWTESTQKWNITSSGISGGPNFNNIRFASQYGQADWCANLVSALTDLGTNPGTILIDSAAGPFACSAGATIDAGQNHRIQFVDGGIYILNQTIKLGIGDSLIGVGGGPTYTGTAITGTALKWTGASSGDMVLLINAIHARVADIGIDCNTVSDCAPIHYDSNNSPITTQNIIENVSLTNGHYGLLVGNRGTSHPTQASCNTTPNQSGCYEMDFLTFRNFQIFGYCPDVLAEGIHVNSYFALQQSIIGPGNIQCTNIAFHNVFAALGNTTIFSVNSGSTVGSTPVMFLTDTGGGVAPNLIQNESEGSWTYAVDDHGCSGSGANTYTMQNNGWNQNILIDGCSRVVSMGNTGGGTWTVGGSSSAHVVSIGDQTITKWSTTGTGTVTVVGN